MKICPYCTAENQDDENYCQYCGSSIGSDYKKRVSKESGLSKKIDYRSSFLNFVKFLFSSEGRVSAVQYWIFSFINWVIYLIIALFMVLIFEQITTENENLFLYSSLFIWVIISFLFLFLRVKRLHDLGRPGEHIFLSIIPIYNIWLEIKILFVPGTNGDNKFGSKLIWRSFLCYKELSLPSKNKIRLQHHTATQSNKKSIYKKNRVAVGNKELIFFGVSLGLILFILAIRHFTYLSIKNSYEKGDLAYQQQNCKLANNYFNEVISNQKIFVISNYSELARTKQSLCNQYLNIEQNYNDANFPNSLYLSSIFLSQHPELSFAQTIKDRFIVAFYNNETSMFVNNDTCRIIQKLRENEIIPNDEEIISEFYFECGSYLKSRNKDEESFNFFLFIISNFPNSQYSAASIEELSANISSCTNYEKLQNSILSEDPKFIPNLFLECGKRFDDYKDYSTSFEMYSNLIINYPNSNLVSYAIKELLDNPFSCEEYEILFESSLSNRSDFIPLILFQCGQKLESENKIEDAESMYQTFLDNYPNHKIAANVTELYADLVIKNAKERGLEILDSPTVDGKSKNTNSQVIIRNDSPHPIRIVFKGPKTIVDIINKCETCKVYYGSLGLLGPSCPSNIPKGEYFLPPGNYEVIMEFYTEEDMKPYKGNWQLSTGVKYDDCYFVVWGAN